MLSWHIPQASSFAPDVDHLVALIAIIVGVWFLLAQAIFFGFIIKFRHKPGVKAQYISGEEKHQKRWVAIPHYAVLVFDILIVVAALRVWNEIKIAEPTPDERVRVISQQWSWTFVHPGADGRLDTADDIRTVDDLNLQLGRTYQFELHSKDVLHSFSIPAFRLKQDAVPGRMITGWFRPTQAGEFDIQCAEICGIGHGLMPARVHVRPADQHTAWVAGAGASRIPAAPVVLTAQAASTTPVSAAQPEHAGGAQ